MSIWSLRQDGSGEGPTALPLGSIVQGKPVVRRGRKARDLPRKTARLPITEAADVETQRSQSVKANLARFTFALALLASMALTIGAGVRWD
jgi:hypothetical protein